MATKTRRASIRDVADLAGVSIPTVSRVLTGAARVSPEKVTKVEAAIEQLGYRPNGAARALVSGNHNIIVVLSGNTTYYGYATTIRGIEESARAAGMMVVIAVIESAKAEHVANAVGLALSQPFAGIIVLNFDEMGVAALGIIPPGIPVAVASGLRQNDRPQAGMDEQWGGEKATTYLLSLGHRTVHHISIPPAHSGEDPRTLGWRNALVSAGIEPPPVIPAGWDPQSGYTIGKAIASDDEITAVFCGNDEIAMGVMRGAREGGRRIPEDLSVVGFDDHPLSELWSPSLTTVRQDFVALGRHSFGLLWNAMEGDRSTPHEREPAELIVRESTAAPHFS
jgi:DNA-binding LacI/PurR family transcriptional regulator